MHNGEKGIWEKWTLYDEATHVPLVIYHPDSPHKGMRYDPAVESIDIFPTLNDILGATYDAKAACKRGGVCPPLEGKSLAAVVMGEQWVQNHGGAKAQGIRARTADYQTLKAAGRALRGSDDRPADDPFHISPEVLRQLPHISGEDGYPVAWPSGTRRQLLYDNSSKINVALPVAFALSQAWRCAWKRDIIAESENPGQREKRGIWFDCDVSYNGNDQVNLMGYSVRSKDFRYTAYFHFDKKEQMPIWALPPASEELYDHRGDSTADLGKRELVNIAKRPGFEELANNLKTNLVQYLRHHVFRHQAGLKS